LHDALETGVDVGQRFGQDPGLGDDGHEVGVALPAGHDVNVQVRLHARPRGLADVDAHIEAVGMIGLLQYLRAVGGEFHQLELRLV